MAARYPIIPGVRFKMVPGFEGYCVGDDGSVWSRWVPRKRRLGTIWYSRTPTMVGKSAKTGQGYMGVTLMKDGKKISRVVHRLVLEAFVGPRPVGMECLHGSDDKSDNRLCNIRWGTPKENMNEKIRNGRAILGEKHPDAKLNPEKVREIRGMIADGMSLSRIASIFNVCHRTILAVEQRTKWTHVI